MTEFANDDVMDAALDELALANAVHVCSGTPADRATAITNSLATVALTPGAGNGDFTLANGDTDGRKLSLAQQADLSITADGTAAHLCYIDGTRLLRRVTVTSQALTSGGTVTIPAHDISEIGDPA